MSTPKKTAPTNTDHKFEMTVEYAKAEAQDIVAEYDPEHLDGRTFVDAKQTEFGQIGWREGYHKVSVLDMCAAIIYHRGVLSYAAKQLGVSTRMMYWYKDKYESIKQAIKLARETRLDIWERKLDYLIEEKDEIIPLIFGLKTQGKARGYIENQVVYQQINVNTLTTEELERLAAGEEPVKVLGEQKIRAALKAPKEEIIDAQVKDVD